MTTATLIKDELEGFSGYASLYAVEPSLGDDEGEEYEYVVVSATISMLGPETYIFGADKDGFIQGWNELPGSFEGGLDHYQALHDAGYEYVVVSVAVGIT